MAASKLKARKPLETNPGKTKSVIYGASGVGKTFFTLTFPTPYYVDSEGGADLRHYQERLKASGGVYMGPEDGALDFDTVIGQVQALATEQHQYKTLIIDSITKLYQSAIAAEQDRLGDKDVFGASKKPAIRQMRRLINWVSRLDMNVFFVAHEVSEWGEVNGQRTEIGKIPDVFDKMVYELDLTLRIVRPGKAYPATALVHKSRLTGFPLGDKFPAEYGEFAARYGKDFIEAATTTITLATAEQVAEIRRMVELLKITPEEQEKVLTRAAAATWTELSQEQANKTIAWLNSKIKGE